MVAYLAWTGVFTRLAHANGLKVIQAPSLDLGAVTGSVLPRQAGESVNQWYLRVNIAGKAAAAGDIYLLQNESNTTLGGQYAYMFNTAQTQATTPSAGPGAGRVPCPNWLASRA